MTKNPLDPYHRPATMTVACPACKARPGHHCDTARRLAERKTHRARVVAYEKLPLTDPRHA